MIDDTGLEAEIKNLKTTVGCTWVNLGAFVLSNSERILKNFNHTIDGINTNDAYYGDTDSLHIENKHWDKLEKAGLKIKNFPQGENVNNVGGFSYAPFLAPKLKYCLSNNKYGIIDEHKSFKV